MPSRLFVLSAVLPALLNTISAAAQQKPVLTPEQYGRWEQVSTAALSPRGQWIAYRIQRVDEEAELRVREVARDSTRVFANGADPLFAANERWLAWTVSVPVRERERLEKEKKPVRTGAAVLDLRSGTERKYEQARSKSFDATGRLLALHGYAPDEPAGKGADLRVIDLESGRETTLGNVAEYAWSPRGSLLAFIVATGAPHSNGVQVYDASSGRLVSLDASHHAYRQLVWRENATDLAVLRAVAAPQGKEKSHRLLAWRAVASAQPKRIELNPAAAGLADTLEVVEHMRPRWSKDGQLIAFGLRPVDPELRVKASADTAKKTEPELAGVEIWHSSDVVIVPQQRARTAADARRTLLAVWDPSANRVVQIGTELSQSAELLEGWQHAIERNALPYDWGTMFGRPYHDLWQIDIKTGQRERVMEKVRYSFASAGGRYLLWFDGKDYWTYDLRSRARTNITQRVDATFTNTTYDTPTDLLPPHGVGGWLAGDAAVLLYDQFDVWRVKPDGTGAVRLTRGAEEKIVHRVENAGRRDAWFDPARPLYLGLRGEATEKRGYAWLRAGQQPEQLVYEDKYFRMLQKADSADVFAYRAEARDDSPDFFVAGAELRAAKQVSRTNPFLSDYAWGKSELLDFASERGQPLQAVLLYPAQHDPARRYPMIVYTYEKLAQDIHEFEVPNERDYYNFTTWTQQGYFVLLPDIVYRAREPGISAIEAVRPAVKMVVDRGLADAARVGLIGHSWGGYQAAYLPTRIDIFAASVAGAPLTDFVSFMGQIHWTPGNPEVDHWETGQARMEVPYWEDPEAHHRNSPIHKVQDLKTPMLMVFGKDDGVVDWDQGTEFYNFARRAGKNMVLLAYDGENHGLAKKPNQVDYHRRIVEWFNHYLKGEPASEWIKRGIALSKQRDEIKRVAEKNKPAVTQSTQREH